jgi:hypothetical protein
MVGAAVIVNWEHDEETNDYDGLGEHSQYRVHQLVTKDIGKDAHPMFEEGGWMVARKIGQNPYKVIGGPYESADRAKQRAEQVEASL